MLESVVLQSGHCSTKWDIQISRSFYSSRGTSILFRDPFNENVFGQNEDFSKYEYFGKTKTDMLCQKTKKSQIVHFVGSLLLYKVVYK
jgi:hypothetical protein